MQDSHRLRSARVDGHGRREMVISKRNEFDSEMIAERIAGAPIDFIDVEWREPNRGFMHS